MISWCNFLSLILLGALVMTSCQSKKHAAKSSSNIVQPSKGDYQNLSKRLNFEVNKEDNIKLYQYIANWLGTKHKIGGCDKSGIDCSCFIRMITEHVYQTKLPRTAADMQDQTTSISKKNLKEGDLVFFNINSKKASHVGIYLKQGWFAHVSTSKGVMINNLDEAYYAKHFSGAGRKD
jgi:lipoprotein Spr